MKPLETVRSSWQVRGRSVHEYADQYIRGYQQPFRTEKRPEEIFHLIILSVDAPWEAAWGAQD
jgi:hypothetical protein